MAPAILLTGLVPAEYPVTHLVRWVCCGPADQREDGVREGRRCFLLWPALFSQVSNERVKGIQVFP